MPARWVVGPAFAGEAPSEFRLHLRLTTIPDYRNRTIYRLLRRYNTIFK